LVDPGFGIRRATVLPCALVRAKARKSKLTTSWVFSLNDSDLAAEGVRDVTDALTLPAFQNGSTCGSQDSQPKPFGCDIKGLDP
jgi:hypothetical protein